MGKKTATNTRAFRLFAVSFLLNGCYAMMTKGKLEQVEGFPDMAPFSHKPSVCLELSTRGAVRTAGKAAEVDPSLLTDEAFQRRFKEAVTRVTEQSGLFESFTFDPTQVQKSDYTIRIELSETKESQSVLRLLLTLPSWACLGSGVTPFGAPPPTPFDSTLTLTASVQDRTGTNLGSSQIEESVIWWCGASLLMLAPIAGSDLRLWESMVKVLYKKILDDRLLAYSSGNEPSCGGPKGNGDRPQKAGR